VHAKTKIQCKKGKRENRAEDVATVSSISFYKNVKEMFMRQTHASKREGAD
jgi:hypothetical protein